MLLGLTVVTGIVDSVSFLALGHVFTANMTGNVVFLAFAVVGTPGLSIPRSTAALFAFILGAVLGGRIAFRSERGSQLHWSNVLFIIESALLLAATVACLGYRSLELNHSIRIYAIIVLTALAMGIRNAAVRKLAVPDMTTTVLTLTITGLAADSSLAGGENPRWKRRISSVVAMFMGAAVGALILRHSLAAALAASFLVSLVFAFILPLSTSLSRKARASAL
jgi:uncharacterized membrane protein YoaK (UPF0700 family)